MIFENGLGVRYQNWSDVQPEIASVTRTCAYDRLGAGQSDPVADDDTRTPFELVATLRALLREVGVEGPYVLVGHSIAGFILFAYPHLHPDDVAGLVFVDSSHPEQFERLQVENPATGERPTTLGAERIDALASLSQLADVGDFGDLPVAVLYQARDTGRPSWSIWVELQESHAARSSCSRLIPATNSGHHVHNDEPELVIEAIRWVLGGGEGC